MGMSKFWSDIVGRLDPYVPGEQPQDQQYIKLNTNESPYPPSLAVAEALANFDCASLRRYPDPESGRLVSALAEYHGLSAQQVFVGNGSDEVLAHAFQALLQKPQPILFPDISYSFYPVYCALYQIEFETVALDAGFNIDINDYQSWQWWHCHSQPERANRYRTGARCDRAIARQQSRVGGYYR